MFAMFDYSRTFVMSSKTKVMLFDKQTLLSPRFYFEFDTKNDTIEITDTIENKLYKMNASEDDIRYFMCDEQEYYMYEAGWNYEYGEPREHRSHYSEYTLDLDDYITYAIAKQDKWSVPTTIED